MFRFAVLFVVVAHTVTSTTLAGSLRELRAALEEGLLTPEEHEAFRAQVIVNFVSPPLAAPNAAPPSPFGDTLVWSDDFDTLNLTRWKHEITLGGGGNWEFEYYANNRSNSFVQNSVLFLQPTFTADTVGEASLLQGADINLWGGEPADLCTSNAFFGCERSSTGGNIVNPIQSARVRTAESFSFTYGRVEVRAKLPRGDWLWPAIWMLPATQNYGTWPASGEIDIMESRGNAAGYPVGGVNTVGSTLHWGPFYPLDGYLQTTASYVLPAGTDFSQDFHIFGLLWTNTSLSTYIDTPSNVVLQVPINQSFWERGGWAGSPTMNNPWVGGAPNAPFDQSFYLIFNVACGGTNGYFPDNVGGKPWTDESATASKDFWLNKAQWADSWVPGSSAMQIDWVKVYQ